jgi:hypothetical protein
MRRYDNVNCLEFTGGNAYKPPPIPDQDPETVEFTKIAVNVTREGTVTGDYWESLRTVERERAAMVSRQAEQTHAANYKTAVIIEQKRQQDQAKAAGKKTKEKAAKKKPNYYEQWGETIERMYIDGWKINDIAACCRMKASTVRTILAKKEKEALNVK